MKEIQLAGKASRHLGLPTIWSLAATLAKYEEAQLHSQPLQQQPQFQLQPRPIS